MFKKYTRKDSRNPYPTHNQKRATLPRGRLPLSEDHKNENKNNPSIQSIRSVYDTSYFRNENEPSNQSIRSVYDTNFDTNYLYAQYMSFFWNITPITDRSKDQGKSPRDRYREHDKIDAREGTNLHYNNYYSSLQNEYIHILSSELPPPLIILEKPKNPKNKGNKTRSRTSRDRNSRSNSGVNDSDSDNDTSKEATNSTTLTKLLAESNLQIGLNETAESPSRGSFLLPPLKKTHHENPWASEFDCTISHTHQYCNDYPDLIIDYPYHSLDDDTSELQGAAAETSDTDALRQILTVSKTLDKQSRNRGKILDMKLRSDLRPLSLSPLPIQTQELLQIRYQLQRGPSSILLRESRLHLRPAPVWRHILQRNNVLNDDVYE